ncbi:MAG: 1-acyl-sn-glycerol-3-phosphate acyltransferase [Opitutaceae bacterium]|jgi:1-acyl-sn-glycerol-3-phosphate acyltransferase|nr:1-acyl-sn-glycerol-3-phosphate acyltransferase [Opitutaceae bacterium]
MHRRYEHAVYPFVYGISHYIATLGYDIAFRGEVAGEENIPETGPFIICANHASHLDPPFLAVAIHRRIAPFARKTLWHNALSSWWMTAIGAIPVDRDAADIKAIRSVLHALDAGLAVMLFPEGTRSPDGRLQPAKAGVGLVACKTRAPVLPCRIFGTHEAFPPGGRMRPAPVDIVIGPLLQPGDYDNPGDGKARYQNASERIMARVAALERPAETVL